MFFTKYTLSFDKKCYQNGLGSATDWGYLQTHPSIISILRDQTYVFRNFKQSSERLLNFHLGNLEYACATTLDHVSALSWDQNESFPQFQGNHTILTHGYETILQRLAEGLDIHLECEVRRRPCLVDVGVEYSTWTWGWRPALTLAFFGCVPPSPERQPAEEAIF